MLQRLNLGGTEVDVFYDSGSSLHLASTNFIECSKLQLIDDSTTNFVVTGGTQFQSTSGLYSLPLKTDRGHIFELTVQGISKITSDMEYQDLKFPILEARSNIRSLSKVNFPHPLGGGLLNSSWA